MKPLILIAAILLTGCATYSHPTKGESGYQADRYECEKDAAAVQNNLQAVHMMDRCMKVKGWRAG
jgi:uncharacterized protein YceK